MGLTLHHFRRVPLVGTNANNGSQAGVFTLNVNNTSSNSNVNIRSQVTFRLGKTKSEKVNPHPLMEERAIPFGVSRFTLERSGKRQEIAA